MTKTTEDKAPRRCDCFAHSSSECLCGAWDIDAVGVTFDQLISALAQCRDLFPAPPPGSPTENAWAQAIADPLSVPEYIRAALEDDAFGVALPAPPPECKTEGEKQAFAFGWWKALEAQRNARVPASDEARQKLIEAAITKATGAHRVLNAYDYEDVFACCEAVLASGVTASATTPGDGVWEALQRLIENAATLGPASQEDALIVSRWRGQFVAEREKDDALTRYLRASAEIQEL